MSDVNDLPVVAHMVKFDLVPIGLIEQVFHAALAVAWAHSDGEYESKSSEAKERMDDLLDVVGKADRYTVPVNHQTGEPL